MFALRWDDFGKRWEATCEVCGQEAHSPAFTYGVQGVDFLNNLWVHREVCQGGATVRLIPVPPYKQAVAMESKNGTLTTITPPDPNSFADEIEAILDSFDLRKYPDP